MKIHFDTVYGNSAVDNTNTTTAYGQPAVIQTETPGGYRTDISGTVMDNNAYGGHGKTTEDVMEAAGQQDVAVQRNYMAVMSNSMSGEDFAKLQEEGFHPGSQDIETVVTIVDKIKAELAKSGKEIAGYTDTLDEATLARITGSEGYANAIINTLSQYDVPPTKENMTRMVEAVEHASQIDGLSDDAVHYMMQNGMEPTIQNIYRAQHATNGQNPQTAGYYATAPGGYYAKKAETFDWEQLDASMRQVVDKAAETAAEPPAMEEAKWLVEQGIELTETNLNLLHDIRSLSFPLKAENVLTAAAIAIADGRTVERGSLTVTKSAAERAAAVQTVVENVPEKAVDLAAEPGGALTVKALEEAWTALRQRDDGPFARENLPARRMLAEVRLQMTLEANLKLIQSNYAIETAPLEKLVEDLKQAEAQIMGSLLRETDEGRAADKASLYEQSIQQRAYLAAAPAAVIGRIGETYTQLTLTQVAGEAQTLQKAYQKAEQSYETLMTSPRADLGDSIRRAFQNVDAMLENLGLESTETNRRAVRILGYNGMDVTKDQLAQVKAADLTVQDVIKKMTPSAVLTMIRDGKNPMSMTIGELDSYFGQPQDDGRETERYSRYLYHLEQSKEITQEEKTSYIGIYRMLRQLEKSDGAAVGSLVEQGRELTFANLLGAVRTSAKKGLDVIVDDNVGGFDKKETKTPDIAAQIQTAYTKELQSIQENLSPQKIKQTGFHEEMSVEAFYEAMQEESEASLREKSDYRREQTAYYRKAAAVSDAVVEQLLSYSQPVSAETLMSAQVLLYSRGGLWKKALQSKDGQEKAERLKESFGSREEAREAYADTVKEIQADISERAETAETAVDVRQMRLTCRQLSLCVNLSREENYEVPVMVQGQITSVNLKILHAADTQSKAVVTMETEELGRIAAEFMVQNQSVTGYLTCDDKNGKGYLESVRNAMQEGLSGMGYESDSLGVFMTEDLDLASFTQRESRGRQQTHEINARQTQNANALYRISRLFLKAL